MDHSSSSVAGDGRRFLRRRQAAEYLLSRYGFGAVGTLAKGVVTGDTPRYHKAGKIVLYEKPDLDQWALSKIGLARRSTSEQAA